MKRVSSKFGHDTVACIIVRRLLISVHKWQFPGMADTHEYWSQHDAHYGGDFTHGFDTQNYPKLQGSLGTQPENTHGIQRETQPNPYPWIFLGNTLGYPWVPTLNFYPRVPWVPALSF